MGRGTESTILKTSITDVYVKLIDAYLEQEKKKIVLRRQRMNRTQVVEDAVLLLLSRKGVLEKLLKDAGFPNEEIQNTTAYLKAEYG